MQQEYEVLRFIEEKENCHICMDYVTGELLAEHIASKKTVEKEVFFKWILHLIKELEKAERARALEMYCVISPFHMVMKTDGSIALLNTYAKVNLKKMQKYSLEKILPFFSKGDTQEALYAFGRTMQYVLAHTQLVPAFKRSEERVLQKIILSCLKPNQKRKYRNLNQIEYKISKIKKRKKYKVVLAVAGVFLAFLTNIWVWNSRGGTVQHGNGNEYLDMGIFCMGILEDYDRSIAFFTRMENSDQKEKYISLAEFMDGKGHVSVEHVERVIRQLRQESSEPIDLEMMYCYMKICNQINSAEARIWVMEYAEQLLQEAPVWLDRAYVKEILAYVYQKEGKMKEAIEIYEELSKHIQGREYLMTAIRLCDKCGWTEKKQELYTRGVALYPEMEREAGIE